jgi:hypothetical protein
MTSPVHPTLRDARQAVLDGHSAAETAHDLDAVIATFHRPRYEIVPTNEVFDGEDAVRNYHAENFAGLPDMVVEPIAVMHGDDAAAEEA